MTSAKVGNNLRLLILALNLVNTELGLTKAELVKRVPGYSGRQSSALERAFERDIAALRVAGLEVSVSHSEPPRYSIEASSFPTEDVSFSAEESQLLVDAASAWRGLPLAAVPRLLAKLGAYAGQGLPSAGMQFEVGGAEHLAVIVAAIDNHQPIQFRYASRRNEEIRDVAPIRLEAQGTRLLLQGFDLNRWAQRSFLLSRIRGGVELVAEPGAVDPGDAAIGFGEEDDDGAGEDIFTVAPMLWVRREAAPVVRLRLEPEVLEVKGGWERRQGGRDRRLVWERLIYDHLGEVVVTRPAGLRRAVLANLGALQEGTDRGR